MEATRPFRARRRWATLAAMPISLSATLVVRDLSRAVQFYAGAIGLEVVGQGPDTAAMGAGGAAFLHLRHDPGALPDDPGGAGLFHLAFLLPTRADLGGWLRHVDGAGLGLDGGADHLVSEAAYLRDPEGNGIEVYADRPRDAWAWDGGGVRMANNRLDHAGLRAGAAPWRGAPAGTRLGHVHLRVGDVPAAVRFCTERLGLRVTRQWPEAAFLSWEGYHHHVAVNTWRSAGARPRPAGLSGLGEVTVSAPPGTLPVAEATLHDPWGVPVHIQTPTPGDA